MLIINISTTSTILADSIDGIKDGGIIKCVLWGIISILTIITNAGLLFILLKKRHSEIVSRSILISIAMASILFTILYLLPRWSIPYFYLNSILCYILPRLGQSFVLNINFHVWMIAVDRYLFIVHPLGHRIYCTKKTTYIALIVVWIVTLIMPFVPLMTYSPIDPGSCNYTVPDVLSNKIFYLAYFILFFFVPVTIIITAYSGILIMLYTRRRRYRQRLIINIHRCALKSQSSNRRILAYMLIFIGVFVLFWLPFVLVFLILQLRPKTEFQLYTIGITQFLAFSYPAVNPLIYSYFTLKIRKEITSMLRQCLNKDECQISCISYRRSPSILPEQLMRRRCGFEEMRISEV
ncbi:Alpha-1A adrenergic receptor [Trichoplax sp. H2]|nr:Alpha-1A adrenergic receptor [Trichoplax sp. H2]|eukprot:RDD39264.1 Alpha-1A adrenergic receptor [Trichoplax sp. H2]